MQQAIIYGGAFNPPTNAHRAILEACILHGVENNAEVWVMPSGNRSDKTIPTATKQRLKLVDAFIDSTGMGRDVVRVENYELLSSGQTQTFQTYTALQQMYPDVRQVWVFGSDSILTMKQWEGGETLFNELDMLIIERAGSEITDVPPKAQYLEVCTQEVSSTLVREHIASQLDFSHLVPPEVHKLLV